MRSSSSSVYQPTTTGIGEANKTWSSGPTRFLGPGGTTTSGSGWPKSMVLLLAVIMATMGLIMVVAGARWHHEMAAATAHTSSETGAPLPSQNTANDTGGGNRSVPEGTGGAASPSATPYITILVVGLLLIAVAVIGLLAYYRSLGYALPCCPGKIAHIRQRLHAQNKFPSGAPICAQYCPPGTGSTPSTLSPSSPPPCSATTLQPSAGGASHHEPPFADISEQQRLMGEDTDRMMDDDPRIVLSPLKSHEEC